MGPNAMTGKNARAATIRMTDISTAPKAGTFQFQASGGLGTAFLQPENPQWPTAR